MHRKVANDLCLAYGTILLLPFETQQVVKRPKDEDEKLKGIIVCAV